MTHRIAAALASLVLLGACSSSHPAPSPSATHQLYAPYTHVWADLAQREPSAQAMTAAFVRRGCEGRPQIRVTETRGPAALTLVELTFGCAERGPATLVAAYDSAGSVPRLIDTYAVVRDPGARGASVLDLGDLPQPDQSARRPSVARVKAGSPAPGRGLGAKPTTLSSMG